MKRLKDWLYRMRLWWATRVLMNTGMVMVNAEDWRDNLAYAQTLHKYVRTSGHINNGKRNNARPKLYALTKALVGTQGRFLHPATGREVMVPSTLPTLVRSGMTNSEQEQHDAQHDL